MSKINLNFEIFSDDNFGKVRTIILDGETWFFAKDVAEGMGYSNVSDAINKHTYPESRKRLNYKAYRETRLAELWGENDYMDKVFINKSGIYCLAISSQLPAAESFKKWIVEVVIPSIEKYGGYIKDQEMLDPVQLEKLEKKIAKLSGDVERYKKRWHELNAEKGDLKAKVSKNKKELKALNEYADLFEDLYFSLLSEYEEIKRKYSVAVSRTKLNPQAVKEVTRPVIKVDAQGFII